MASSDEPVYEPKDAISHSARSTMVLGGAGLFISAVQNALTRQNVGGWGVITRTGGTIVMFAAIGGTFGFARIAAANLREKEDAYNQAIGGFFAGSVVGFRMRSFPAVLGFGALVAIILGTHEYTGGKLSGFARDHMVDQYQRKEQLRRNRRRPIEETLQELGEGRGQLHDMLQVSSANLLGELREQVNGTKSNELDATARNTILTHCLTDVNDLKNEIGGQASQTTPHDQRTYDEVLKELNKQLQDVRSEIMPKRKFAFKPQASTAPTNQSSGTSAPPFVESSSTLPLEESSKHLDPESVKTGTSQGDLDEASALSNVHHGLRTENSFGHADRGIVMTNSSQCVIKCAVPSPKLTIDNVQSSVLLAGPINGATFVTGMIASVLVVACRQLRMHRCRDCVVYLRCSSRPIIEDCSNIQFAPFPEELVCKRLFSLPFDTKASLTPNLLKDMAPLDGTISDQWDQVHDFNWLKAGHSPNWTILEPEKRKSSDQWKRLKNPTDDEAGEILRDLRSTGLGGQDIDSTQ
ncbi:MAG: hypothetical protein Q9216_002122 [Gyalolechia sp. 2 TL-2023]